MREKEHNDKQDDQNVFKDPCLSIHRMNRGDNPHQRTNGRKNCDKKGLLHEPVFSPDASCIVSERADG